VKEAMSPTGTSQVEVLGVFRLHGKDHEIRLPFFIALGAGSQLQATAHFSIPIVAWGLHDPSTFILRVEETVDINIHAAGQLVQLMRA
jgi:polyisoprenoid-binding protein YceI